ncbi:MAG TPA: hypothetical protein VEQ85_07785 [Lacipirellulaceae bacterium]|nr:hypothetical protein [Lacipirellulaceae bacterium]
MPYSHDAHDAQLEEIVAYLDGELTGEACARVERRLASDEEFRQELQGIERAWTALDDLPMTTVDDRFSRTTMSLVIEAATQDLSARTQALPVARRRRWLSSTLAASVALALGFLAFRLAWHDPNRALTADLAVIDNVDLYSQFQEVEFLRMLQDELGGELEHLSGDSVELDDREQHFADVASPRDGPDWLRGLDEEERTNLRAKFNRFSELPPAEQDRMRSLHNEIVSAPDARRLERTMLAYQQWLGGLPPVRQFELRNMDNASARVAQVKRWATQMRDDELLTLTDDELKAFFFELSGPIKRIRAQITRDRDKDDDRDRLKALLSQDFARWRSELVDQFENDRNGGRRWFYRAVIEALPGRSRFRFAGLPPDEKVERFLTWMRQHTACRGEVTQEELEHFFAEELDPEMRAQLLSLPPGEMEQALRRMYRCQPKTGAEGRWSWSADSAAGMAAASALKAVGGDADGREEAEDDDRGRGDEQGEGRDGPWDDRNRDDDGRDGGGRNDDGREGGDDQGRRNDGGRDGRDGRDGDRENRRGDDRAWRDDAYRRPPGGPPRGAPPWDPDGPGPMIGRRGNRPPRGAQQRPMGPPVPPAGMQPNAGPGEPAGPGPTGPGQSVPEPTVPEPAAVAPSAAAPAAD